MYICLQWFVTSEDFRTKADVFNKFVHTIENTNFAFPYKDWDNVAYANGENHHIKEFQRRFKNITKEILASWFVNTLISFLMLVPLWYTSKLTKWTWTWHISLPNYLGYKIIERHSFLERFIGTKDIENASLAAANNLVIIFSTCVSLFSMMEIGFYLLYHGKVIFGSKHSPKNCFNI